MGPFSNAMFSVFCDIESEFWNIKFLPTTEHWGPEGE